MVGEPEPQDDVKPEITVRRLRATDREGWERLWQWADGPYCYLEDLFVDRAGRGAGVAGRLFEVVYETARKHGARRVYWLTQQYNGAARSLYDTVGHLTSFVVYEHEL